METIKISVEVSVNLSENTQKFLTSLFAAGVPSGAQVAASVSKPAPTTPAKPAPAKPTPQPAAPAQTQSAAEPAPSAPAQTQSAAEPAPSAPAALAASSASKSIEDVRGMLAKKVNEHRDVIKQKLNELGAPSVTKLDPAKYDEMYNFLESL
jgi:hypothetical protein